MAKCNPVTFNNKEYKSEKDLANALNLDDRNYRRLSKLLKKRKGNADIAVPELLTTIASENKETEKLKDIIGMFTNEPKKTDEIKDVKEEPKNEKSVSSKTRCYYEVTTPADLIELVKRLDSEETINKINLIDFENVCNRADIYEPVLEEGNVNIFFYNALKYSDKFYNITRKSNAVNIKILTFEVADQLVDHMLIFYLGALNAIKPEINYNIVARDLGYYRFMENLEFENINCIGINYITDKDIRYKYCICKFISESKIQNRQLLTITETRELFKEFFKGESTNEDFNNIIKILEKDGLVEQMSKNSLKWYKFKIKEINEFVNIYKS